MTCQPIVVPTRQSILNPGIRTLLLFGTIVVATFFPLAEGTSQAARISGIVYDFSSANPLPGVRVTAMGGVPTASEVSGVDGRFDLVGLPAGELTIRFERSGYVTETETFDVLPGQHPRVDIYLTRVDAILEELLVRVPRSTDAPASEELQRIQLQIPTTTGTVADLLRSSIPGLIVDAPAEANAPVGRIRIRGSRSLVLGGNPVVFVNGIRAGGRSMEVLREIPLSTVKSVEVLKGAAAMSYGLDSTNGVILIQTQ